jgi:uncharacterized membrane protein
MNRMLVVVFDNESRANEGAQALRQLHADGSISLYGMGVIARDAAGHVSVKQAAAQSLNGTGVGLAVGCLIGLLGGPAGLAIGAVTGTAIGALRDYWTAGVGIDFVAEAEKALRPGKVAVVAEVEEDWVIPVDDRMEAAGGIVSRCARADVAADQFDRDIGVLKADLAGLKLEAKQAGVNAKARMDAKVASASSGAEAAVARARQRIDEVESEGAARLNALGEQMGKSTGAFKVSMEKRMAEVKGAYDARAAKLRDAWHQAREAFSA